MITLDDSILQKLPARPANSHKGSFGRVLVIAGSSGMAGAAYFSAAAAYRTGAGLVEIVSVAENRVILQTLLPEAIFTAHTTSEALLPALERADAIVLGPGLGQSRTARNLIAFTLAESRVPHVIDADALNEIAKEPGLLPKATTPRLFTPHMGEMARLTKRSIADLKENAREAALAFAKEHNGVCVLKDARTIVAAPSGENYQTVTPCSGLATGGSGDVLTGVIAALAAAGVALPTAALGVYLHNKAGRLAASRLSDYSLTARDILAAIPEVLIAAGAQ